MASRFNVLLWLIFLLGWIPTPAQSLGQGASRDDQSIVQPNTSESLQNSIQAILNAAKTNDVATETRLIHFLLLPADSTWFKDEYGPGFGANLSAAYQRASADLELEMKSIFEGNVKRGWMSPKVVRYVDPESVNAPLDHFLNCMDQIVPLYAIMFQGDTPRFSVAISTVPGSKSKQTAGDPDGYFIYDRDGFRFIPMDVLMRLPSERPVRIKLDMNVMQSKVITKIDVGVPDEAVKKRLSGQVVVDVVLDTAGNIKDSKILEGNPIFSEPVINALKRWRFAPTMLDGDPVEVEFPITFTFQTH
jgi:TonB family protein